jgi:hypothetical protein
MKYLRLVAPLVLAACSSSSSPAPGGAVDAGGTAETGSVEAGGAADSGGATDSSSVEAGGVTDSSWVDEGGSAEASAADGGDTWASWAQGFFATYCIECHAASDPTGRNYTIQANVERDKREIRCGVAAVQDPAWGCASFPPAKKFPISDPAGTNPKPSDGERARVVAWITAGAP